MNRVHKSVNNNNTNQTKISREVYQNQASGKAT